MWLKKACGENFANTLTSFYDCANCYPVWHLILHVCEFASYWHSGRDLTIQVTLAKWNGLHQNTWHLVTYLEQSPRKLWPMRQSPETSGSCGRVRKPLVHAAESGNLMAHATESGNLLSMRQSPETSWPMRQSPGNPWHMRSTISELCTYAHASICAQWRGKLPPPHAHAKILFG